MSTTLIKSIREYIDGRYFIENTDILFNDRIICIGECNNYAYDEVVDASHYTALPTLYDHYICLHDYIDRLGIHRDTVSRNDFAQVMEIICLEKILNGVSRLFIDLGYINYSIPLQGICKHMEIYLGRRIGLETDFIDKYVPVVDEDVDPDHLISILKEINSKIIYIRFLIRRKHPFLFKEKTGLWPIAFLEKNGIFNLNKYFYFIGFSWASSMDLEVLKYYRDKLAIIILPTKTMYIANGGFTPLYEIIEDYGIKIFLGTSGLNSSVLNEARLALLLYRYNYWDQRLSIEHIRKIIFQQEHKLFYDSLLEKGSYANISLYNIYTSRFKHPLHSLIFNEVSPVYVFVKGYSIVNPENRMKLINRYRDLLVEIID